MVFYLFLCRMVLNLAHLSAINLNYKGKAGWFGLVALSPFRCTGSYGKSHEERQDYSQ